MLTAKHCLLYLLTYLHTHRHTWNSNIRCPNCCRSSK